MITILGTCRQSSINKIFNVTSIQEKISYTYSTKEILQVINFCKFGNLKPEETLTVFRTPMLNKNPILFDPSLKNEFNDSQLFIIEIAGKKTFNHKNNFIHEIALDEKYNVPINRDEVIVSNQTKEEIEEDLININLLLNNKIIIVTHLVTSDKGERFKLSCWLKEICKKYNIILIDPIHELKKIYNNLEINNFLHNGEKIIHYTEEGHNAIQKIYKKFINKKLNN